MDKSKKDSRDKKGKLNPVCQIRKGIKQHHRKIGKLRKEAVLHLRIENDVMECIKMEARARDMSVSDIVRRRLSEHFRPPDGNTELPGFLRVTNAWSDVVVAQGTRCAVCEKALQPYTHAWMAQGPPPPTYIICSLCYDGLKALTFDAT